MFETDEKKKTIITLSCGKNNEIDLKDKYKICKLNIVEDYCIVVLTMIINVC